MLIQYDGPIDALGKVEQFFLQLLSVPRLRSRLEALEFKLRFAFLVGTPLIFF